jgi:hypothetical protein
MLRKIMMSSASLKIDSRFCSTESANPATAFSTVDRRTLQKATKAHNVFSTLPRYLSRFAEHENWAS